MYGFKKPSIYKPKMKAIAAFEAAQIALAEPDSTQGSTKCIPTRTLHNINVEMDYKEGNCVYCVAFSNDSEHLAATGDGFAQVYDHRGRFCWKMDSGDRNCWPITTCT